MVVFQDRLFDFCRCAREIGRLVIVLERLGRRCVLMVEALAELPVVSPKVEGVAELDDVGVVTERDGHGGLVDFVGVVGHVGEAHLVETIAPGADAVVHRQNDDLLVPRHVLQRTHQDVDDYLGSPAVPEPSIPLCRADR